MLEKELENLYFLLRNNFCKSLFAEEENKDSLNPTEAYCVEMIYYLNRPTVHEFAKFVHISQPNATYRINNLIEKGYIRKVPSTYDRREYFLEVTDKFSQNYGMNSAFHTEFIKGIKEKVSQAEIAQLEAILNKMLDKNQ